MGPAWDRAVARPWPPGRPPESAAFLAARLPGLSAFYVRWSTCGVPQGPEVARSTREWRPERHPYAHGQAQTRYPELGQTRYRRPVGHPLPSPANTWCGCGRTRRIGPAGAFGAAAQTPAPLADRDGARPVAAPRQRRGPRSGSDPHGRRSPATGAQLGTQITGWWIVPGGHPWAATGARLSGPHSTRRMAAVSPTATRREGMGASPPLPGDPARGPVRATAGAACAACDVQPSPAPRYPVHRGHPPHPAR